MSKLEVDKIDPQSGTDLELGTSGDTITIPAGVTFDSSAATNTLPSNVVTTDGTQTLTNKNIVASQLTGTVATSNLGTGTADSTTFLRGDQTFASATPADNSITTAQLAYNPNAFRNIIINGDMSIAQRATSVAGITSGNYYTVDRFNMPINTMGTFTVSQSTDTPSGQGFSSSTKYDCTTADASPAAGDFIRFEQYVEAQNLQYLKFGTANAESLTLSFWVKSTKTGTYIAELRNFDGGRTICNSYTINVSNTWEKKTITVAGDTDGSGAFNNDNGLGLACIFWLGAGSDFTSGTLQTTWGSVVSANRAVGQVNLADSTSNDFYITGVQLEAGTTASEFEFLPFDVNLQRCQRYYEKSYNLSVAPGTITEIGQSRFFYANTTSGYQGGNITFSVKKRTSATITSYAPTTGASGNANYFVFGSSTSVGSVTIQQQSERCFNYYGNGISCDSSGLQYTADAEL